MPGMTLSWEPCLLVSSSYGAKAGSEPDPPVSKSLSAGIAGLLRPSLAPLGEA